MNKARIKAGAKLVAKRRLELWRNSGTGSRNSGRWIQQKIPANKKAAKEQARKVHWISLKIYQLKESLEA